MPPRTANSDLTITPTGSVEPFATAMQILQTLRHGKAEHEAELRIVGIEDLLARPGAPRPDPEGRTRGNRLRLNSRTTTLQAQRDAHRARVPPKDTVPTTSDSSVVAAGLEVIRGGRPPTRVSRQKLKEQLQADLEVIDEAIFAQAAIVDELRDRLSADLAKRLVPRHRELTLAIFRAAQALAAASDAEAALRRTVIDAGYTWRADLLRGPQLRSALVLGSESTFDSDISRARRFLEEEKML